MPTMDDRDMNRLMMMAAGTITVLSALTALGLVVWAVMNSLWLLVPAVLVAAFAVLCAMATSYYTEKLSNRRLVFSSAAEQEVLNRKQQRELRVARGEVVMQRALVEVENERDNLMHRQLEASRDPSKPPHKTRFGD
jgi:hypothetical protein